MNTKRFLVITLLAALFVGMLSLVTTTKSTPAKAEVQVNEIRPVLANEPAVRMQSGVIQFSDNNSPDLRSQIASSEKPDHDTGCISDESAAPRRYGGCAE